MHFDQLPSPLLMMIAKQTDMVTRGCMMKTCTRMQAIYSTYSYYKSVDRVEISRTRKPNGVHNTIVIHDSQFVSETHFTEKEPAFNYLFPIIGHIVELSFRDVECAYCQFSNILHIFPELKLISKLTFKNCAFAFTGNLLIKFAGKLDIRRTEITCPSVVKDNGQKLSFDKFFSLFPGSFQITVRDQRNSANIWNIMTDEVLSVLMENPREIFKLENVICNFSPSYLTIVVKAMISGNSKIDWNLGVITIPIEEQTFYHNCIHHTLMETAFAVNANYATNSVNVGGVECVEYVVANQHSQIKFMVKHVTKESTQVSRKQTYLRKRNTSSIDQLFDYGIFSN